MRVSPIAPPGSSEIRPAGAPAPKVGNPRRQLQQLHLRLDLGVAQLRIEPLSVSHHISPWHTGNTVAKS